MTTVLRGSLASTALHSSESTRRCFCQHTLQLSSRRTRLCSRTLDSCFLSSVSQRSSNKRRLRTIAVMAAAKAVLVPIANGSEEIEAVTVIDVLRRAGAVVTVASVEDSLQVEMSRKVKLVADKSINDCKGNSYDLIALPGGMPGAERLRDSAALTELLEQQKADDKLWSAICAAPAVVFESKGWLKGKKATAHPAFSDQLAEQSEVQSRVVVDGKLITSRGPGTALEFALALVTQLYGEEKANEVAKPMVV